MRRLAWWVLSHFIWKSAEEWIEGNRQFGDMGPYANVPRKRFMSAWEWWGKWSNLNS